MTDWTPTLGVLRIVDNMYRDNKLDQNEKLLLIALIENPISNALHTKFSFLFDIIHNIQGNSIGYWKEFPLSDRYSNIIAVSIVWKI